MEQEVDILQLWWRLNTQLHPWSLFEFTSRNSCRIHKTSGHNEMHCSTFLSRMELGLQGKNSFSKVHEPIVPVKVEPEASIGESEFFMRFKEMVMKGLSIEKDLCIEGILLPCWCRIHNTTHSEVTCPSCKEAIHQAKKQIELEESANMYTIEKWWNAHLQPIDLASNEEGITTTSCSEESTIERDNQHNLVKRKFAYLIPRKGTPIEVEGALYEIVVISF